MYAIIDEKGSEGGFILKITKEYYGKSNSGQDVYKFILTNNNGTSASIISYGARLTHLLVKGADGKLRDVIAGYDNIADFENYKNYYGAICGRFANRIADAKFELNGKVYNLEKNDGENSLHGGIKNFSMRVWNGEILPDGVKLTLHSDDMEEGFPGNLDISVTYKLTKCDKLQIFYEATCDQDTIINVTNHSYFNLTGQGENTVLDHVLKMTADKTTVVDSGLIPTGEFADVAGTPFDFLAGKTIGQDIASDHPQMQYPNTYDHNFVLPGEGFREVAWLTSPVSGITMTVSTDQPGMQIYVCNSDAAVPAKGGVYYPKFSTVCLETQHYPDGINHKEFPSVVLKAGDTFTTKTEYAFCASCED